MKSLFLMLFGWLGSVRSVVTMIVAITFCWLALVGKIDPKDFMLIVSLVFNFYFMNKVRTSSADRVKNNGTAAAIILALGLLLPGTVMADTSDTQIIAQTVKMNTMIDIVKKIPAVKSGIGYSAIDNKINFLSTFQVATYKNVNFELGYSGDAENAGDKVVGVVSYKLVALKDFLTVPVLDLIECNVGVYYGIGNIGAGNEQDYGVTATAVSFKF